MDTKEIDARLARLTRILDEATGLIRPIRKDHPNLQVLHEKLGAAEMHLNSMELPWDDEG